MKFDLQAESIHALGEEIGTKLARAETAGAEGKVEESMDLLNEVEELKKKKSLAEVGFRSKIAFSVRIEQIFCMIVVFFSIEIYAGNLSVRMSVKIMM